MTPAVPHVRLDIFSHAHRLSPRAANALQHAQAAHRTTTVQRPLDASDLFLGSLYDLWLHSDTITIQNRHVDVFDVLEYSKKVQNASDFQQLAFDEPCQAVDVDSEAMTILQRTVSKSQGGQVDHGALLREIYLARTPAVESFLRANKYRKVPTPRELEEQDTKPFEGTATDLFVGAFNEAARPTQIKLAVSPRVRAAVDDRQNPDMLQNTLLRYLCLLSLPRDTATHLYIDFDRYGELYACLAPNAPLTQALVAR
jgi:hypothetical protein